KVNISTYILNSDPKWFKLSSGEAREDNWVNNFNKLRRLVLLLTRYYEEILGLPSQKLESPDTRAIAKDGNLDETMKLYSLIVTLAVNHSNKAVYIEKITHLNAKSQEGLMYSIERVMKRLGESTVEAAPKMNTDNLGKIVAQKEALEKAHQALMEEHTALRDQCDDLQAELEETKNKKRYEKQVAENLRKLSEKEAEINDLSRKNEVLSEQANEAARLKDQVDEYRHAADELRRKENVIEKYKKKLEEAVDLRRNLKTLEQENRTLVDRNQAILEEYDKVAVFKGLMENYKKQLDELQSEKIELVNQKNKLEYEYRHMKAKFEAYEMAQSRDQETIHLLEDRLRELELGEGEPLKLDDKIEVEVDEIDQSINNSELSDALKGDTMTSLRLKINELQRELSRLREGKPSDDDANTQLLVLKHQVDDANRVKAKFETDYVKVQKEKLILESELERLQEEMSSSSNGVNKNEHRKGFERDQKELLDTKKQLREIQMKLERAERDMGDVRPDSNTEARIKALEDEKESLKIHNAELTSLLQTFEEKSEDDLKKQNVQLHRKVEQLKTLVTGQHEIVENYKNAITSFEAEREAHTAEVKRLEQLHKESKEQAQKEINLVTSAWFNMGRRIQGDHVFLQRQGPASFLNQQRLILDTQPERTLKLCELGSRFLA
ncbi:3017_t:CDS:10, partial [Funneliformis geosporum]